MSFSSCRYSIEVENLTDENADEEEEGEEKRCPSCGEKVNEEDIKCENCGEGLLGDEPMMDEEEIVGDELNLEEKIAENKGGSPKTPSDSGSGSDSIPSGLSSLGGMIEEKVMASVKQREERIRDSMKKTVRERERKIREKMQNRIDKYREKYDEEKSKLMDRVDKEREEKEEIRKELEGKIENLRGKIDEKASEMDELKEKHVQEKDELREKYEGEIEELEKEIRELKDEHTEEKEQLKEKYMEEKEELKDKLQKEKEDLREKYEKEKKDLREKYEKEKKELQGDIEELREKHEKKEEELREKLEEEKEELADKLREEKKELRYNLEKEKVDLKNRMEKEIEHLEERLEEEREKGGGGGFPALTGEGGLAEMGSLMGEGLSEDIQPRLNEPVYPFPAIVGQERMKRALLLNAINPAINGVLIWGEEGCGKRTAIVALAELLSEIEGVDDEEEEEVKIWNDQERYIAGTIHSSKTDTKLMVDTVLKNGALNVKNKENCEKTGTPMITVDNPSIIDKHMLSYLEGFNLQVKVEMIDDIDKRREIIRRNKEYQKDPEGFYEDYEEQCHDLRDRIVKTRQTLGGVTVSARQRNTISNLSAHASLPSGSDILLEEVARTVTAYDGREEVKEEDIQEAVDILFVSKAKDFLMK